jgi:hypothetical protein
VAHSAEHSDNAMDDALYQADIVAPLPVRFIFRVIVEYLLSTSRGLSLLLD